MEIPLNIIEQFLNNQEILNKSVNTVKAYGADVAQFIDFIFEREDNMENIQPLHIRSFLAYLSMQKLSKKSIARKLSSLKAFFDFLTRIGSVETNPASVLNTVKVGRSLPSTLTLEEFKHIIDAIDLKTFNGKRDKSILEFLYASGARSSEMLNLKDIDLDIRGKEAKVVGKGSIERIVFFNDEARDALFDYMAMKRMKFPMAEYLFINRFGTKLSSRFLRKLVEEYAAKAGIAKEVSPHTFRHSFATAMLDSGVSLRVIQTLLGHASISSTQIYTHISREELRRCYIQYGPFA